MPASESLTREELSYPDSTTVNRPQGVRPIRWRSRAAPGPEFPYKGVGLSTAGLSDNPVHLLVQRPYALGKSEYLKLAGLAIKSVLFPALGRETEEHSF